MVHTAVPISLLGMQCTTALRSKKIQSQKPTKHEKQQSPFSSLNLGASLPQTPFCFSPWHSLAPTPRHWGTGEGSWERPRLPNTGNPVKTLSASRRCPTPSTAGLPGPTSTCSRAGSHAQKTRGSTAKKSLLCLSLEPLPVPTPSQPACSCRNSAGWQYYPLDSSY